LSCHAGQLKATIAAEIAVLSINGEGTMLAVLLAATILTGTPASAEPWMWDAYCASAFDIAAHPARPTLRQLELLRAIEKGDSGSQAAFQAYMEGSADKTMRAESARRMTRAIASVGPSYQSPKLVIGQYNLSARSLIDMRNKNSERFEQLISACRATP
jgi:hypothetical protein